MASGILAGGFAPLRMTNAVINQLVTNTVYTHTGTSPIVVIVTLQSSTVVYCNNIAVSSGTNLFFLKPTDTIQLTYINSNPVSYIIMGVE